MSDIANDNLKNCSVNMKTIVFFMETQIVSETIVYLISLNLTETYFIYITDDFSSTWQRNKSKGGVSVVSV